MKKVLLFALALAVIPVGVDAQDTLPDQQQFQPGQILTTRDGRRVEFVRYDEEGGAVVRPVGSGDAADGARRDLTVSDLVNEVYAGRNCRRSALMESLSCQYRVGEDLEFEIANVGDPKAFINVWSAVMRDGDFFIGTTPLHDPGDELIDYYPCIVIKPGNSNPTYRMIIHHVYVSPRTGDVYEREVDCKTDG